MILLAVTVSLSTTLMRLANSAGLVEVRTMLGTFEDDRFFGGGLEPFEPLVG